MQRFRTGKNQKLIQMIFNQGGFRLAAPCTNCGGQGQSIPRGSECTFCDGVGKVKKQKTDTIDIPAGIDNGMRIRMAGKGDSPLEGKGPAGDLILEFKVAKHPQFARDGANIIIDVPVPLEVDRKSVV